VRKLFVIVTALVAVFIGLTLWLFVFVPSDHATKADAIVVLSGDRKRLDEGMRLFQEHVAPTLVISRDFHAWPAITTVCPEAHVLCIHADPYSTRGEAETTARLARRRHWSRIVVVTSRYHLRRARMLFDRCGLKTKAVAATTTFSDYAVDVPWEWGKFLYQLTVQRSC
jgi:uncharacterized SAM-binding protein YcdF (DUF218 family)